MFFFGHNFQNARKHWHFLKIQGVGGFLQGSKLPKPGSALPESVVKRAFLLIISHKMPRKNTRFAKNAVCTKIFTVMRTAMRAKHGNGEAMR